MRRAFSILALAGFVSLASIALASAEENAPKIQVLLITGDDAPSHPWKEIADTTRDTLVKSGKFDVKVSEDLKPLESADDLKAFDVIVFTRYDRKGEISDTAKENLLAFVKDGKGFFIQHLATASFPKWDEFSKLCGRHWVMGPSGHGPRSVFESKIVDKDHPISKGLEDFSTDDELYAKLVGDEPIHILVAADSDWSKKTEPLVFWKEYGTGRVVHNAYGHDGKALSTPAVQEIIVRGVEWAAKGKIDDKK